jgi:hypothetical protein
MNIKRIKWWHIALFICLVISIITPLASSSPDGLEKVAEDKGFADAARSSPFNLIANYVFPGIHNKTLATILAGLTGTILIFGITYLLALLLKTRKQAP